MDFFIGCHQPADAQHLTRPFISRNRLKDRKSGFKVGEWIMDSGAFTQILKHGGYTDGVEEYAAQIRRWSTNGTLLAAVAQDYMCEAHMLKITGMTVPEHQRLTIERYDDLLACDVAGVYILPVLQGYEPEDYAQHVAMYGARLAPGAWVGVGSVCKRNGNPAAIVRVLQAIKNVRPDLRLHGFGLKSTALSSPHITALLHTSDSMAWSFAARREGRNPNDWQEAKQYADRIHDLIHFQPVQKPLF